MRNDSKCGLRLVWLVSTLATLYGCMPPKAPPGAGAETETGAEEGATEGSDPSRSPFAPRPRRSDDEGGKRIVFTEDQAVELGSGFDSDAGELLTDKKCVLFVAARKGGRQAAMSIRSVTDNHSLSKALKVSAAAEVNAVLGSGKGKAEYARSVEVNSSSLSYAVHAQVEATQRYARGVPTDEAVRRRFFEQTAGEGDPDSAYARSHIASGSAILLTDYAERLARRDLGAFLDQCGDGFVSSLFLGVELAGVLTLDSRDETEKESFAAAIEAQGPWWKAEAAVDHSMSEFSSSQKLKVSFHETGRSDRPLPASAAELMDRAQNVKELLADPRLYKVAVTPYSRLLNWPLRQELELEDSAAGRLLYRYGAYRELFDLTLEILAEPDDWALDGGPWNLSGSSQKLVHRVSQETVRGVQDDLQAILAQLRELIEDCDDQGWDDECESWLAGIERLRDPYSYRSQLPPPDYGNALSDFTDEAKIRDELAGRLLRAYRDRACDFSPDYPACISNAELSGFAKLIPLVVVEASPPAG
jgi:hypothetical protein